MNKDFDFSQVDWGDYDQAIDTFESNQTYFRNKLTLATEDISKDILNIHLHYVNGLYSKSYYEKALIQIKALEELGSLIFNEDQKNHFLYIKGMILGNQKKHKESLKIFKELVSIDPDNYSYREWLNYSKYGTISKSLYVLTYSGIALIIIDLAISIDLSTIAYSITFVSVLVNYAFELYFKRKLKQSTPNKSL